MPEIPPPESGLDLDDIRRAVLQAQRDKKQFPRLSMLTDDVPAEYEPTGDEIPEVENDGDNPAGNPGRQDGGI